MDFKTRFQGKISHISKDGAIDSAILSTEKMAPIGKTAAAPTGGITSPMQEAQSPVM